MLVRETFPDRDLLEVINEPPVQTLASLGALAAKEAEQIKARTPEECAAGKVEHLLRVFEGVEDKFRFYGVFDEKHHLAIFEAMNELLGIPNCAITELEPKPTVVIQHESGIALVRWSNIGADGLPFDVYYQTFTPDELLTAGIQSDTAA